MDTFIEWNPSLSFDENDPRSCILEEGYSYRVRKDAITPRPRTTATTSSSETATTTEAAETPKPRAGKVPLPRFTHIIVSKA